MGTPKPKQQNQPQRRLSKAPTGKRKNPFSLVTHKAKDHVRKIDEFKIMNPKKKQKKRASTTDASTEAGNLNNGEKAHEKNARNDVVINHPTASQQLSFFLHKYQSATGVSSFEVDSLTDACMLDLDQGNQKTISVLGQYVKRAFGSTWKEMLYEKQLKEGKENPGNPVVIVIASSALRSLELLRELQPLTKDCPAVKLFSKHMKIEEQVALLKSHVNIACGTPSRIKKLIELEALGLSRLTLVVLDMYRDVKGYSLFTLPQVREEFWDLFKKCFHEKLVEGHLRINLYGSIPAVPQTAVEEAG